MPIKYILYAWIYTRNTRLVREINNIGWHMVSINT